MKKVLIALDYSDATSLVAEKGDELAAPLGCKVFLVHVLAEPSYYSSLNYSPILGFDSFSDMDVLQATVIENVRVAAGKFLQRVKEEMNSEDVETIVREGDFAGEIRKVAEENEVDVIVLGRRVKSGLDKLLLGSVTESVIRKSDKPIYIIPINKR